MANPNSNICVVRQWPKHLHDRPRKAGQSDIFAVVSPSSRWQLRAARGFQPLVSGAIRSRTQEAWLATSCSDQGLLGLPARGSQGVGLGSAGDGILTGGRFLFYCPCSLVCLPHFIARGLPQTSPSPSSHSLERKQVLCISASDRGPGSPCWRHQVPTGCTSCVVKVHPCRPLVPACFFLDLRHLQSDHLWSMSPRGQPGVLLTRCMSGFCSE